MNPMQNSEQGITKMMKVPDSALVGGFRLTGAPFLYIFKKIEIFPLSKETA